jgi:hypothetical protein
MIVFIIQITPGDHRKPGVGQSDREKYLRGSFEALREIEPAESARQDEKESKGLRRRTGRKAKFHRRDVEQGMRRRPVRHPVNPGKVSQIVRRLGIQINRLQAAMRENSAPQKSSDARPSRDCPASARNREIAGKQRLRGRERVGASVSGFGRRILVIHAPTLAPGLEKHKRSSIVTNSTLGCECI